MGIKLIVAFLNLAILYGACDPKIPEAVKKEYALDIYRAFELQSQGQSTTAFCSFDIGYEKAKKVGFSSKKLESLKNLFVWYRTYGYFLGIIARPTGIIGEYRGSLTRNCSFTYGETPEKNAKIRDFLFGVSELIAGTACVYFLPTFETKLAFGTPLIYSGTNRIWTSLNEIWLQNDISMAELKKVTNDLKKAVE